MWLMSQRHPKSGWNDKMEKAAKSGKANFVYDSLTDASVPLVSEGRMEARASAQFIDQLFITYPIHGPLKAYCTPQRRGEESLDIQIPLIKSVEWVKSPQAENPYYEVDLRLAERDFGEWAGMTPKQVLQRYENKVTAMTKIGKASGLTAKELKTLQDDIMLPYTLFTQLKADKRTGGFHARPPGGEAPFDVATRLKDFGGTIARQRDNDKITRFFVETHGEVSKILPITYMKKDPYKNYLKERKPGNTAIRLITSNLDDTGYVDHGYIYDPENGINILEKNHIPHLEKYLY